MSTKGAFSWWNVYGCGRPSFKIMSTPVFVPIFLDTLYIHNSSQCETYPQHPYILMYMALWYFENDFAAVWYFMLSLNFISHSTRIKHGTGHTGSKNQLTPIKFKSRLSFFLLLYINAKVNNSHILYIVLNIHQMG